MDKFRLELDRVPPSDIFKQTLVCHQASLWGRLKPRLDRIQREAANGCRGSLEWIECHLEKLGYILARGELLELEMVRRQELAAAAEVSRAARRDEFEQARREYEASRTDADREAEMAERQAHIELITEAINASRIAARERLKNRPRNVLLPTRSAPPSPSCEVVVGSESWLRELEIVRRGSELRTVGPSRAEDVIPRK